MTNISTMLKITVITVCYNERDKVEKTIESVCEQTYPNIEYLIIDGASTDGTINVLQKYSKCEKIYVYSEPDYGIYNAMNRGIARASGEYIFFLNAGDVFYNKYVLANIIPYISENTEVIYFGKICMVQGETKSIVDYSDYEKTFRERLFKGNMPCHQCIFSPRKFLTDHYFRECYELRADYEWLFYSAVKGKCFRYVPVIISCYDVTGMSSRLKNYILRESETQKIVEEYKKGDNCKGWKERGNDELAIWKQLSQKHFSLFQLMNYWMGLKQQRINVGTYLYKKGYRNAAIYGLSYMGQTLLKELKEGDIKVEYAVDQNAEKLRSELQVYSPMDKLGKVDIIIVTAVMYYSEIKSDLLEKIDCPVVSLEDLLYEIGEGYFGT